MDKFLAKEIGNLYNAVPLSEHMLGNSANAIYEMTVKGQPVIIRISEYSLEKQQHIDFELKWMSYLSRGMDGIAHPIPSGKGALWHRIEGMDKAYLVSAFIKAPGRLVDVHNPKEWNGDLFERLGMMMGKMHALSMDYPLSNEDYEKYGWDKDVFFASAYALPEGHPADEVWRRIISEVSQIPKTKFSYGVIHNDIHHQNFFVAADKITLFDFDDCLCSWFMYDVGLTFYHCVNAVEYQDQPARDAFAAAFLKAFLEGYRRCCDFDNDWLYYMDLMLRYRRIYSYRFVHKHVREEENNPYQDYLKFLEKQVLADDPVVFLDYDLFQK